MDNTIYIILGVLIVIYLAVTIMNRRQAKERKSRKFMEKYKRKEREQKE
ncbi:hypothetical protein [Maribacter sp. 2307ULW6-5]